MTHLPQPPNSVVTGPYSLLNTWEPESTARLFDLQSPQRRTRTDPDPAGALTSTGAHVLTAITHTHIHLRRSLHSECHFCVCGADWCLRKGSRRGVAVPFYLRHSRVMESGASLQALFLVACMYVLVPVLWFYWNGRQEGKKSLGKWGDLDYTETHQPQYGGGGWWKLSSLYLKINEMAMNAFTSY